MKRFIFAVSILMFLLAAPALLAESHGYDPWTVAARIAVRNDTGIPLDFIGFAPEGEQPENMLPDGETVTGSFHLSEYHFPGWGALLWPDAQHLPLFSNKGFDEPVWTVDPQWFDDRGGYATYEVAIRKQGGELVQRSLHVTWYMVSGGGVGFVGKLAFRVSDIENPGATAWPVKVGITDITPYMHGNPRETTYVGVSHVSNPVFPSNLLESPGSWHTIHHVVPDNPLGPIFGPQDEVEDAWRIVVQYADEPGVWYETIDNAPAWSGHMDPVSGLWEQGTWWMSASGTVPPLPPEWRFRVLVDDKGGFIQFPSGWSISDDQGSRSSSGGGCSASETAGLWWLVLLVLAGLVAVRTLCRTEGYFE